MANAATNARVGETFQGLRELHVTTGAAWRRWLRANHRREPGVWLVYDKRHTKRPRIPYQDALEEALCFGWIDALVRTIDHERYAQKWTTRRPGSGWSETNRGIAQKLIEQGRMTKAGLAALGPDPANPPRARTPVAVISVPKDVTQALRRNAKARAMFDTLAPSYRSRYLRWIADAKRDETRRKRIARVMELLAQGVKASMK